MKGLFLNLILLFCGIGLAQTNIHYIYFSGWGYHYDTAAIICAVLGLLLTLFALFRIFRSVDWRIAALRRDFGPALVAFSLALVAAMIIIGGAVSRSRQNALVRLLDVSVPANFAADANFQPLLQGDNYQAACFTLREFLQEQIAQSNLPNDVRLLSSDVRVLIGAPRQGNHPLPPLHGTVGDVLRDFATAWDVVLLLKENVLIIADPGDASRFPHDRAIARG